jgi:hypothetical protein
MREFLAKISPATGIGELKSALFVVHGENDPRVPISETRQIVERARATGRPVWTLYASNEGHGFGRRENTDYEEAATAEFFRRHLLAASPPADASTLTAASGPVEHSRAIEAFRAGMFREAAGGFDRAVAVGGAHSGDACWERGLARYYAGDLDGGRMQFEAYHRVGPTDIENGLWIYICAAPRVGVEKARAAIPEYRGSDRPPFPALLDLYLGRGSVEAVLKEAMDKTPEGKEREEALFYAHLYAAKQLETVGKPAEAKAHIEEALKRPIGHFMHLCALAEKARRAPEKAAQ